MQHLFELYEMVSLNPGVLVGPEKLAISRARVALDMFEKAMDEFNTELSLELAGQELGEHGCNVRGASVGAAQIHD